MVSNIIEQDVSTSENGKRYIRLTIDIIVFNIDNIVIERVNCNKFLGVIIDSKLSWSDHVSYIRHKMSKNISVIAKWLLNNSALYMIYCTLVLPYISYCCEIWGNTYNSRVQPLYIMQKRAIRMQTS